MQAAARGDRAGTRHAAASQVLAIMRNLARDGMTMLIVVHELEFASEVANRIVFMDAGAIIEEGPPAQCLVNPKDARTRLFIDRFFNRG